MKQVIFLFGTVLFKMCWFKAEPVAYKSKATNIEAGHNPGDFLALFATVVIQELSLPGAPASYEFMINSEVSSETTL